MVIVPDKVQEPALLLAREGLAAGAVVDDDGAQLEAERVLPDEIVVLGHLEGGAQHPAYGMDGAVALALTALEGDEPALGVDGLDVGNPAVAELVLTKEVEDRPVTGLGRLPDARAGVRVGLGKLINGPLVGGEPIEDVLPDGLLLLAERGALALALGGLVFGCQGP